MILGIGNPKRRRLVIRGTNAKARVPRPCPEVIPKGVVVLATILQHGTVTVGIKCYIVLHQDVVGAVDYDAALLAFSDNVPAHDAAGDAAGHVEVDGIPSQDALLAKVADLGPLDVLGDVGGVQDDEMAAVEGVVGSVGRSVSHRLEDDGTAEPRHLGRRAGILGPVLADGIQDGIRSGEELGGGIEGLDRHEGLGGLDRPDDLILPASRRLGVGDEDLAVGSGPPALGRPRIGDGDLMGLGAFQVRGEDRLELGPRWAGVVLRQAADVEPSAGHGDDLLPDVAPRFRVARQGVLLVGDQILVVAAHQPDADGVGQVVIGRVHLEDALDEDVRRHHGEVGRGWEVQHPLDVEAAAGEVERRPVGGGSDGAPATGDDDLLARGGVRGGQQIGEGTGVVGRGGDAVHVGRREVVVAGEGLEHLLVHRQDPLLFFSNESRGVESSRGRRDQMEGKTRQRVIVSRWRNALTMWHICRTCSSIYMPANSIIITSQHVPCVYKA